MIFLLVAGAAAGLALIGFAVALVVSFIIEEVF